MMINTEQAKALAHEWIEAWNAHDLERIVSHYSDDIEMNSPYIAQFTGEESGTLRGKAAVGAYWKTALAHIPDLRFELIDVFVGANSIAIFYNAALGRRAVEILFLNEADQIWKAAAHYDV